MSLLLQLVMGSSIAVACPQPVSARRVMWGFTYASSFCYIRKHKLIVRHYV